MSVTIIDFPWSGNGTPSSLNQQYGAKTLVPADGSATVTVTFPNAFGTTIPKVLISIADVSAVATYALTAQTSAESLTGFTVYVAGGAPGSTCTVNWQTLGGA